FGLGFYGHVRVRTGDRRTAFLATVMVLTSMAIWHYLLASGVYARVVAMGFGGLRSEEHTSELQSRFDLVCRLLLEKKKHEYLPFRNVVRPAHLPRHFHSPQPQPPRGARRLRIHPAIHPFSAIRGTVVARHSRDPPR